MNRTTILGCILMASVSTAFAGGTAKIHGKIANPLADSITFTYFTDRLAFDQHNSTVKITSDGSFQIDIPVEENYTNITVQNGDQGTELFVQPGDDLTMTFDGKDFDNTMRYTGKGSQVANFTAKHIQQLNMTGQFSAAIQPLYTKEPEDFITESKAVLQKELDFLAANKASVPESFTNYWKALLTNDLYYDYLIYPTMHEMYKTSGAQIKEIPAENYKVAMEIPVAFNDASISAPTYRNVVGTIYFIRLNAAGITDGKILKDSVAKLANKNMPLQTREFFFAETLSRRIKESSLADVEQDFASFKKDYPKSIYLPTLDKAVSLKKKLSKGQPAIDFSFTTLDGKQMKLSDLKGKVVYIDFWASWCGPCKRELPYAKKVEEHFKDKDVVFLNVSIDDDQEAWKKAIETYKIEGIHTCEPGGWKSRIAAMYGVNSVPSYFLIDKKGKFVAETTPRPSDTDNLTSMIEASLK